MPSLVATYDSTDCKLQTRIKFAGLPFNEVSPSMLLPAETKRLSLTVFIFASLNPIVEHCWIGGPPGTGIQLDSVPKTTPNDIIPHVFLTRENESDLVNAEIWGDNPAATLRGVAILVVETFCHGDVEPPQPPSG